MTIYTKDTWADSKHGKRKKKKKKRTSRTKIIFPRY